jgi:hypothetical protein
MLEQARKIQAAAMTVFPLFVVIGIFGLEIWPVMYISLREKRINEALGAELIPHWVPVTQITLLCTTIALNVFGRAIDSDDIVSLSMFTGLAMGVVWIVFAFKAKRVLEDVVTFQWKLPNYRLNAAWTLFFSLFYIVYCLNDLPNTVLRFQATQQATA